MLTRLTIKARTDANHDLDTLGRFLADVAALYEAVQSLVDDDDLWNDPSRLARRTFLPGRLCAVKIRLGSLTLIAIATATPGAALAAKYLVEIFEKVADRRVDLRIKIANAEKIERENRIASRQEEAEARLKSISEGNDDSLRAKTIRDSAESLQHSAIQVTTVTVDDITGTDSVDDYFKSPRQRQAVDVQWDRKQ